MMNEFDHSVIVDERNFVCQDDDDVHMQHIENTWMRTKNKLKWKCGKISLC